MKKILTIILDGFGYREELRGNAIKDANMECFNSLWKEYPHSLLEASGKYVGLQEGKFGNSETGHQTIGAGRLIKQHETLVDEFLNSNVLENEAFNKLLLNKEKDVHLMGLCSDGYVHSNINSIIKFYMLLVKNGFTKIHFHIITDGRDTGIHSALNYINYIEKAIKFYKVGSIATICGRYYAMDRDRRYDRTKRYYDLITRGIGIETNNIKAIINEMYDKKITDEFMEPIIINRDGIIKNGDSLVWLNYREDRAKQIISAFVNSDFEGFRPYNYQNTEVYSFLPIDEEIKTNYFKKAESIENPLGIYLSKLDLTQARIAETEKFAHVTYFFDGGFTGKIPKCNQFLIPSPKVTTYDLKPEMSAVDITKKAIECMSQDYDFILMNFANADMVGHTGNYEATVQACMAIDICLKKIIEKAEENFYKVIITADHGNADMMFDDEGNKITTHTTSKVPFIILDKNVSLKESGDITMIAPTILGYMDIAVPDEMKETESLLK